ncbi:hypothetical protein CYMTET_23761 [Cymbomonas tetramitiformis]|uniref:Uncharacterized protein n=1 Tax=Cymbomonas tetramitiformis TaxID=36881 RepID=A0AAE0L0S3_9CHLO|nr:hypothetical protein CYMTET_23761 [Cymbomonas tetramitiformis]
MNHLPQIGVQRTRSRITGNIVEKPTIPDERTARSLRRSSAEHLAVMAMNCGRARQPGVVRVRCWQLHREKVATVRRQRPLKLRRRLPRQINKFPRDILLDHLPDRIRAERRNRKIRRWRLTANVANPQKIAAVKK